MFYSAAKPFVQLTTLACVTVNLAATAQASDSFRYVSIAGNNANPCTLAQPCRSIQRGIGVTPPGGTLHILDSGFYGNNATINKSMTISGNGNAIVLTTPITIDRANATVALRRLVLDGQASQSTGIAIDAAARVHIEHCLIYGYSSHGIFMSSTGTALFVSDTISRDNGQSGLNAFGSGTGSLMVDNSRFENNVFHGLVAGAIEATVTRSIAAGNGSSFNGSGFLVFGGARMNVTSSTAVQNGSSGFDAGDGEMTLESVVGRGNNTGLTVGSGQTARISNSSFTNNTTGVANGGTVETLTNNTIRGNVTNKSGNALTSVSAE